MLKDDMVVIDMVMSRSVIRGRLHKAGLLEQGMNVVRDIMSKCCFWRWFSNTTLEHNYIKQRNYECSTKLRLGHTINDYLVCSRF